jgi:aromatic ring-opening dioxygenase catalytic subunit (LigB family)
MALAPPERTAQLLQWEKAPMARAAHPREEHLLPLMVALGAAEQEPAACVYHEEDFFGSLTVSSFRFGAA